MIDFLNALALLGNFLIVPGLTYGSQLALGALGVTMVYAVLRFSNFGHGETMAFGAMVHHVPMDPTPCYEYQNVHVLNAATTGLLTTRW